MPEVRLDHLTKVFPGGTTAVDDFSLTIRDGEFLVLVGPSGCGKSTVLRMIAGLEDVSAGEVFIDDAMVRRPRVFLLDEPLSNLDAKLRVSMRAELARLHQRYRTTTVYVTHDQVEAMTLGDRIAVIDKGVLQQVGTPEDLYRRPGNRFVAGFMGSPSMNFATAGIRGRTPVTVTIGGQDFEVPEALHRWPDLERYIGSTVVMGLRPAAFSSAAPGSGSGLLVRPLGVESLGDEKHVLFDAPATGATTPAALDMPVTVDDSAAAQLWTAKVSQYADLAIGRPVLLSVDLSMAYFSIWRQDWRSRRRRLRPCPPVMRSRRPDRDGHHRS